MAQQHDESEVELRILTPGEITPELEKRIHDAKGKALLETQFFSVSFLKLVPTTAERDKFDLVPAGSGTFVSSGNCFGILTVYHVAKELVGRSIGLVISEKVNSFHLQKPEYEIIPIGVPAGDDEAGPDLALIWIINPDKVGTIKSLKTFYRLDGRDFEKWRMPQLTSMPWWVNGAPAEMVATEQDSRGAVLRSSQFSGEGNLIGFESRDGFEYITIAIRTGEHGYPADYRGVSGGGIWLTPIRETGEHASVVLGGVAYYQKEHGDSKVIIGHGPGSIYGAVATALEDAPNQKFLR